MKNNLNTEEKDTNKTDVISRLSSKEALDTLEVLYNNMSNPKIVNSLKEQFERDGYKAGFCDGFRAAIKYALNGL